MCIVQFVQTGGCQCQVTSFWIPDILWAYITYLCPYRALPAARWPGHFAEQLACGRALSHSPTYLQCRAAPEWERRRRTDRGTRTQAVGGGGAGVLHRRNWSPPPPAEDRRQRRWGVSSQSVTALVGLGFGAWTELGLGLKRGRELSPNYLGGPGLCKK
jgi:hypothetical protein